MGDVFAQSISRQQSTLIGVPYSLRFMMWIPENKGKCKKLLLKTQPLPMAIQHIYIYIYIYIYTHTHTHIQRF
jgi:hypothetical protein